ncbi:UDP-2,3-diacylglucosamine diphosphatase [Teredinibacter purpureus]|uniref:UDP-2,3-diacylglucosamine diphosphatase n=1 Tax=Teredinibacter purpureus TaxID=2731756 RepID=UPI0005F7DFF2|nr:UDP-2,3-diacylglucosamine diphosphatase [Teredinibacter purpureus]
MTDFFISDLHLHASRSAIAEAFFSFVEKTVLSKDEGDPSQNRLYILGDFFDAWIGDDDDDTFAASVKLKLRGYANTGLQLFFQHGNRDFLIGNDFASATGMTLLQEEHVITVNGDAVLLMHGDSLCVDDVEYMQFRAQVRNTEWQQQILQLPLEQRRVMAQQLRSQSQSMNAMKAEDIMDVNAQEVENALARHELSILIHGHTHRPNVHELKEQQGLRYVLGDWESNGWYIRADEKGLQLLSFTL